jgi:TPP-dependent trihydroxycyclohexane-1,2-dione (THcHDO) dehydratase
VTERIQLTVAQAVVKFLARQYSERDGLRQRLVEGCSGIRFANIKVADLDGRKLSGLCVVDDAREALQALTTQLAGWQAELAYTRRASDLAGLAGRGSAAKPGDRRGQ